MLRCNRYSPVALIFLYVKQLELVTDCHHEEVLLGLVDVAEVDVLAEFCTFDVVLADHLADAEVVVDVEGDFLEDVEADASLNAPCNAVGVECLLAFVDCDFFAFLWSE